MAESTASAACPTTKTITKTAPSKAVLLQAARILVESENDADFPIAEIMLRNILVERATAEACGRLERVAPQPYAKDMTYDEWQICQARLVRGRR
jgi:hypothetical protein